MHADAAECRAPCQRGFTFIELMIVLLIVGLCATVVAPALMNMSPTQNLRSAAHDLAATIDLLRGTAIGRGQPTGIVYDIDANAYRIYGPSGGAAGGAQELVPIGPTRRLGRHVRFVGIQPQGLRYQQSGTLRVRFDPMSVHGSHIVYLENTKEQRYSVKYNAFIGQALAVRGEAEFEEAEP